MILLQTDIVRRRFPHKLLILTIKKHVLQNLLRWIWDFCNCFDPCVGHLYFLRGMNLQFTAITMRMHFFSFYMSIYTYIGVRSVSKGVDFVLGIKGTLNPGLIITHILRQFTKSEILPVFL